MGSGARRALSTPLAIVVAAMPVAVAGARAALGGWLPQGDNAYFTVRSRDVLGPNHPLVGAWSSGSTALKESVNNLGPLQLDLLAPFTRVAPAAGTAIGVALVNVSAMVGIGIVARRVAGPVAALAASSAAALVAWWMGSALLVEPRQHHALLLPFLFYLVACWALATGDGRVLPAAAFAATLLVQTHFSYVMPTVVVGVWGVGALIVRRVVDRHRDEPPSGSLRTPLIVTAGILVLSWAQPLVDQVAGTGNIGRVFSSAGDGGAGLGLGGSARLVADVVARPATWRRSGFGAFDPARPWLDRTGAALSLLVLVLVLGAVALVARRRHDDPATSAVATAVVAIGAVGLAAASTPAGSLGPVAGNYRWLWPVTAFTLFAAVLGVLGGTAPEDWRKPRAVGVVLVGVALLVAAVATLPASYQIPLVAQDHRRLGLSRELVGQLERAELPSPVLVDRSAGYFGEAYSYQILLTLQRRHIGFTFDTTGDVSRFGRSRADRGRARARLLVVTGPPARRAVPGARRVAFVDGVSRAAMAELAALGRRLADDLATGRLALNADGERAMAEGAYPALAAARAGGSRDDALDAELRALAAAGRLAPDKAQRRALARSQELRERDVDDVVAVFLAPRT